MLSCWPHDSVDTLVVADCILHHLN